MTLMAHPKDIGDRTTLAVMLALHDAGYQVSTPFGENTRYDLVLDDGTTLTRLQCKTGRMRLGAVEFATASSYAHHPNEKLTQRHYRGQVDAFAVYCRETGGVYVIPIEELPLDRAYLRVREPLNGQRKRIRFAEDYEIATVKCTAARRDPRQRARIAPASTPSPSEVPGPGRKPAS
jgi:hypothetical protein